MSHPSGHKPPTVNVYETLIHESKTKRVLDRRMMTDVILEAEIPISVSVKRMHGADTYR